jgi:ribokinase
MAILVVGDVNADITATLPHFPHEGDDATVRALSWGSGGSAANTAVALAKIGTPVRLLARVGNDPTAHIALRAAKLAGVDLRAIQVDRQSATGLCYAVISPNGERTFFSYRGANTSLSVDEPANMLARVAWLHLGGHALIEGQQRETSLILADLAVRLGIPISLDLCLPLLRFQFADLLAFIAKLTMLFANEIELLTLAQADHSKYKLDDIAMATKQLRELTNATIVAKCGATGCIIHHQAVQQIPAFPVTVADTNGCGDSFVAGYLSGHLAGADPEIAGMLANACGALAASKPGAAEAIPDFIALRTFLNAYPETHAILQKIEQQQGTLA